MSSKAELVHYLGIEGFLSEDQVSP